MDVYRFPALVMAGALVACGGQARGPDGRPLEAPSARASLVDSTGQLAVSVTGLTPGEHGMHIHETGSCTPPDFKSAGNHLNPAAKQHGLLSPEGPHAGDLPNLLVEDDGSADTTLTVDRNLLAEGPSSMLGSQQRAFVTHGDPDDQKTDPSGNSGARVVCGVIERG